MAAASLSAFALFGSILLFAYWWFREPDPMATRMKRLALRDESGETEERFTDRVIAELSTRREGVVFLLWGRYAQQKGAVVDASRHHVLTASHPSPYSAASGFFGCRHFSRANALLAADGRDAVDWALD